MKKFSISFVILFSILCAISSPSINAQPAEKTVSDKITDKLVEGALKGMDLMWDEVAVVDGILKENKAKSQELLGGLTPQMGKDYEVEFDLAVAYLTCYHSGVEKGCAKLIKIINNRNCWGFDLSTACSPAKKILKEPCYPP